MNNFYFILVFLFLSSSAFMQCERKVSLVSDEHGDRLQVDGENFMINGMNWDYFPIGTNYSYSLWEQSEDFIKKALASEMSLLKDMGVNAIRQYTGVPAKWVNYIYEEYGIYTMINHSFGRYGLTLNGEWVANTDYADPMSRELILKEVEDMVNEYKNSTGLLLYLLGNENNYGLFWGGAETEDIPIEDRQSTIRARHMYTLFNEGARLIKKMDAVHPVALCNGDLQFLDLILEECPDVDIFGVNMYRGASFGDAFERIKNEYKKPILFTEFGADAYNVRENKEDQSSQAYYLIENWKEIYGNAAGMGKTENCIGGFTFQFSDGWWKYGQTINLDVHDTTASWTNGGYLSDFSSSRNNMNEEWFGICAKGKSDGQGFYSLNPRAAYFALKAVHNYDVYSKESTLKSLDKHFEEIEIQKNK